MRQSVLCLSVFIAIVCTFTDSSVAQGVRERAVASAPSGRMLRNTTIAKNYGEIPLSFEMNQGQASSEVRFSSRGPGYSLYLRKFDAVLALTKTDIAAFTERPAQAAAHKLDGARHASRMPGKIDAVRMEIVGGYSGTRISGINSLSGSANYLIGDDPRNWHVGVPTYGQVRYSDIYPGVDLVYYGNQRQLEYDFVVAPTANPKSIRLRFSGVSSIYIALTGDLVVQATHGTIAFHKPQVYQETNGKRHSVQGRFALLADKTVGFVVGNYDHATALVIDPILTYSTYLGGSMQDAGDAIAVDGAGNAYVVGFTGDANFPTTTGAVQSANNTGGYNTVGTAFVAKLNSSGTALVYSTYIGGSTYDYATAVAVDNSGDAYVAGYTSSTDFPTISGGVQTKYKSSFNQDNAFVAKLNPAGTALVYSTYLGGSGTASGGDQANAIAVDASGNAYVAGFTYSTNFPVTAGSIQTANNSGVAAFLSTLNSSGTALRYSTYLGGSYNTQANGIALDSTDNSYIAGLTSSPDFPVASGVLQGSNQAASNNGSNAFVAKLNLSAANLSPTFTVTATPNNPSQTALSLGHSVSYTVSVSADDGFSGTVALSVSGLPTGVTASLSPTSVTTSAIGSATLTLNSAYSMSTYIGNSVVVISGTNGSLADSTTLSLTTRPLQYKGTCGVQ